MRPTRHAPSPEIDAIAVLAEPVVDTESFEFAAKTPLDLQIYSMSVSFKCCCFDGRILDCGSDKTAFVVKIQKSW